MNQLTIKMPGPAMSGAACDTGTPFCVGSGIRAADLGIAV